MTVNITMEEIRELRQQILILSNICTATWRCLILGDEKKAMSLMSTIIDLLERILSIQNADPLVRACQEGMARPLPRLLKAMEERNGILLADILEYELKPILADTLEHTSECPCGKEGLEG